jgi:large subunit ribosomal protein L35
MEAHPPVCHNHRLAMPKMKTHSGAKKRFKLTATGKVRGRHAFTSHILEKKSPKRKRALGAPALLSADDTPRIKRMLGAPTKSSRSGSMAPRDAPAAPRGSKAAAKKGGDS